MILIVPALAVLIFKAILNTYPDYLHVRNFLFRLIAEKQIKKKPQSPKPPATKRRLQRPLLLSVKHLGFIYLFITLRIYIFSCHFNYLCVYMYAKCKTLRIYIFSCHFNYLCIYMYASVIRFYYW